MKFNTADLCDQFGEKVQITHPNFKSYGAKERCFGKIRTIKLDEDNSDLVAMLRDEDGTGYVAVVDVNGVHCAVVGDNLMGFALKNNWAGIIINGYVRDTQVTKTIEVGLWALGTYPLKSRKKAPSERDIELNFGGVTFTPDEYIYSDHDGIVVMKENVVEL